MRTTESLRLQYEVERDLAARLRHSSREGRTELFKTLYGELFDRVPDHGRLTRRESREESQRAVATQLRLIQPLLGPGKVLLEFAPGDCRLALAAAPLVAQVVAADISDQRAAGEAMPDNLRFMVYDGYHLPLEDASVDVAFSYQFLEHLHPDDVDAHFALAARVLKTGGAYVFDTPHRYSGPHDIAGHFGHELTCLHMREWTYRDLRRVAARAGFTRSFAFRRGRPMRQALANALNDGVEAALGLLPRGLQRKVCRRPFASVALMCVKG